MIKLKALLRVPAENPSFIIYYAFLLLFGVVYTFLTPPFQSPDEPNHFFRAWQISEGRFVPEKTDNRLGGVLPESLSALSDSFLFLKNRPDARLDRQRWRTALAIPLQLEKRRFTDFANTAIYAPTAYLPQTAAIMLLRPLGATPLQILYAARLANFLVWMALIIAALRLMPFMRNMLAALALLPASLFMAASANADVITNGLCWWLIAALLYLPPATSFWKKLVAVLVIAMNKIITITLVLLSFLPAGRRSSVTLRRSIILLAAGLLTALCWSQLAQSWFIPYDAYNSAYRDTQTLNSNVNPAAQMDFVVANPLFFIKTTVLSLVKALPSMGAHFVGKFGWEKNYLPGGWIALLWMMLAAVLLSEKNPLSSRQRGLAGLVVLLYVGAFALSNYALWTAVGSATMDNWQGRYFVAVAPVAVLALAQGWLSKWKKQIDMAALLVLVLGNFAMMVSMWQRYWE